MRRLTALITSLALAWMQVLATGVFAQETDSEEQDAPSRVQTIEAQGTDGWAVVEIRQVEGTRIVLTPVLGKDVDLEESNRFALFQGRNVFNDPFKVRLFNIAVAGLQKATFMRQANGKPSVKIEYRSGKRILTRKVPIRTENELRLLREYVEHFDEIQDGTYKLEKESKLGEDEVYPMDTDEQLTFEERRPLAMVVRRTPASVVLKDGERLSGEFVPVYEDGQVLLETDLTVRRLAVVDIDRLRFRGDRGSGAIRGAINSGIGGAATGALAGSLAAWQSGSSVKRTALFAAAIFGTIGFIFGMVSGTRSAMGSREFVLGPMEAEDTGEEDTEESGRERRSGRN